MTADGAVSEKPLWFFLERYNQAFIEQVKCFVDSVVNDKPVIVGAVDGIKQADASDRFCYFRIDRQDDMTVAYRYSDELLRTAIDASLEVR